MKKILYLFFTLLIVQVVSKNAFAQKEIFIKEFQFELKKINVNQYENEYSHRFSNDLRFCFFEISPGYIEVNPP